MAFGTAPLLHTTNRTVGENCVVSRPRFTDMYLFQAKGILCSLAIN